MRFSIQKATFGQVAIITVFTLNAVDSAILAKSQHFAPYRPCVKRQHYCVKCQTNPGKD